MAPRETKVHVGIAVAVIALGSVAVQFVDTAPQWLLLVAGALSYGLLFGGAHLYLALRGEGGEVSLVARWRFLGFLAAMIGLGVVAALAGEVAVGPVVVRTVAFWSMGAAILAYFVGEGVAGYRESQA